MVLKVGDKIKHISTGDMIIVKEVKSEKGKPYSVIDDKGTPWIIDFELLSRSGYGSKDVFQCGEEIIVVNDHHCIDTGKIKLGEIMTVIRKDGNMYELMNDKRENIFLCAKCIIKKQILEPDLQNICKNKNVDIDDLEEFF